jgi:hypothetical protein
VAAYPPELGRAMVVAHLSFFPLWAVQPRMTDRDAVLWRYQALVEAGENLLGVLAGLNGLYYSTFQFKRLGRFCERMRHAPPDLSRRLDGLFGPDPDATAVELEALVAETLALVEALLPEVDTSAARRSLGRRARPWT